MEIYTILLPNEKEKTYRFVTLFLLILNCTAFGYTFLYSADNRNIDLSRFGFLLSLVYICMYFVKLYTRYLSRYKLEISFIILGILWLVMGMFLIAGILIISAIMGLYVSRIPTIIITKDKITYPSFPPQHILWNEISNIILKDDILTIDLKNNKLLQHTLLPGSETAINEKEFNHFCMSRLNIEQI